MLSIGGDDLLILPFFLSILNIGGMLLEVHWRVL